MFAALEDNQVKLSTMKASRFVKAFEQDVDKWERVLSHILEVVEMLLQVQRQWMYLEVNKIFQTFLRGVVHVNILFETPSILNNSFSSSPSLSIIISLSHSLFLSLYLFLSFFPRETWTNGNGFCRTYWRSLKCCCKYRGSGCTSR